MVFGSAIHIKKVLERERIRGNPQINVQSSITSSKDFKISSYTQSWQNELRNTTGKLRLYKLFKRNLAPEA